MSPSSVFHFFNLTAFVALPVACGSIRPIEIAFRYLPRMPRQARGYHGNN
jgi:hypothetical protein